MNIETASIVSGDRIRSLSDEQVNSLMNSIAEVGLLNPVTVYELDGGFGLIAGAHRLEACKRLGLVEIPAQVVTLSEVDRIIAECDENLCAPHLTASERAEFTDRRKKAYEIKHPETVHGEFHGNQHTVGSRQVGENQPERFTTNTAKATGQSERAVQRDAERGAKIISEVLELVRDTKLDTGTYLDKLKNLTPNDQVRAATRDLARAKSEEREEKRAKSAAKVQAGVKAKAAQEAAEIIAEYVPGEWLDAIKANLYAAGAKNIADVLTNIISHGVLDRSAA